MTGLHNRQPQPQTTDVAQIIHKDVTMKRAISTFRAAGIGLAGVAALAVTTGAALAEDARGGVKVPMEGAAEGAFGITIDPVYHGLMVHFPIALWLTAALFIFFRVFSNSELAVRLQKSVWPLILLGSLAGFVAYGLGLSIYPWSAITESPLGRNHIMLATWTLSYWTVMGIIGYRFRRHLFEGGQRWVTFLLTLIGTAVVTITGTLGGSLGGAPSLVTKSLGWIGWEVYMTFYLPIWMLWVFAAGAVVIIALGVIGSRARA